VDAARGMDEARRVRAEGLGQDERQAGLEIATG